MAEEEILPSGIPTGEPVPDTIDKDPDIYNGYIEEAESVEDEFYKEWLVMPRGKLTTGHYQPPQVGRMDYLRNRTREAFETNFYKFDKIDERYFVHLNRNNSINYYPIDTVRVMSMLSNRLGGKVLYVVNGFRSTKENLTNAHTAGLAMDFMVESYEEAREIADAAYTMGIRAIAIQGEFNEGEEGFVHVDIGPAATWAYDGKAYQGPGL